MEVISNETHFGAQIAAGVSCGPGTLMHIDSNGQAILADHSESIWAYGVALTSGAGTKAAQTSQYVRLDRVARVIVDDYVTLTTGNVVYAGEDGKYATSGTQQVGFALDTDEVYVDLDMQLGA